MRTQALNLSHFLLTLLLATFALTLLLSCGDPGPRSDDRHPASGGWLGVYVQDLDPDLRQYLDVREPGVLVNDIVSYSPAEKAGLRKQDIILRFDGRRIRSSRDLTRILRSSLPGDALEMEIMRDGSRRRFDVRIGEREDSRFAYDRDRSRIFAFAPADRGAWLGIKTADLDEDLAAYFDVEEYEGVLVVSVVENSPAQEAGIRPGDVILNLDGKKVRSRQEIGDFLREYKPGEQIEIELRRNREVLTVHVGLERSDFRGPIYEFDFGSLHDWHNQWSDRHRETYERHRTRRRHLENLDLQIRQRIDRQIRREIEIPLREIDDEIRIEMETVAKELEREMRRVQAELRQID